MEQTAMELGGLAAVVLAGVEGLGRAFKIRKDLLALIVGPLLGVFGVYAGVVQTGIGPESPVWMGLLLAAGKGLAASVGATGVHTLQKQARNKPITNTGVAASKYGR